MERTKRLVAGLGCWMLGSGLLAFGARGGEALVRPGETVAFLGDSITGSNMPTVYVALVKKGLAAAGVDIKVIKTGIAGQTSRDMLARLEKDVLAKKPDWMTLNCGVNDVSKNQRGGTKGVALDEYKQNVTAIVDRAVAAGIKVLLITPTPIQQQPDNAPNKTLAEYVAFLREFARARNLLLADANAAYWREIENPQWPAPSAKARLAPDGVHLNAFGGLVMAECVMAAFGLDQPSLAKAREELLAEPGLVPLRVTLTLAQYAELTRRAEKETTDPERHAQAMLAKQLVAGE